MTSSNKDSGIKILSAPAWASNAVRIFSLRTGVLAITLPFVASKSAYCSAEEMMISVCVLKKRWPKVTLLVCSPSKVRGIMSLPCKAMSLCTGRTNCTVVPSGR